MPAGDLNMARNDAARAISRSFDPAKGILFGKDMRLPSFEFCQAI